MAPAQGASTIPFRSTESYTPEHISEAASIVDSDTLYSHAKQIIQAGHFHSEIIYTGLSKGASAILDKLDEDLESSNIMLETAHT